MEDFRTIVNTYPITLRRLLAHSNKIPHASVGRQKIFTPRSHPDMEIAIIRLVDGAKSFSQPSQIEIGTDSPLGFLGVFYGLPSEPQGNVIAL